MPIKRFLLSYFLLFVTIISGAFVSGTEAGLSYNNFPFMGENLIPEEIFYMSPTWLNFFENTSLIQLNHRILATITSLTILLSAISCITSKQTLRSVNQILLVGIILAIVVQYTLGVLTLVNYVPVSLGIMHQFGGLLNLTLITLFISNNTKKKYEI